MSDKCPEWSSQTVWSILQTIANDPYECTWYQDGGKRRKASKERVEEKQQEEIALLRKLLTEPEMERVWKRLKRDPRLEIGFYLSVYRLHCEVIHTDTKNEEERSDFIRERLREVESLENWFEQLSLNVDPLIVGKEEVARQLEKRGEKLKNPWSISCEFDKCFAEMRKRLERLKNRPVIVNTNAGYQHRAYFVKGLWRALEKMGGFESPPCSLIAKVASVVLGEPVSDDLVRYHLNPTKKS